MKKIKKVEKAKFFCESCGAEVNQNARVCTNCGKFFSSVRCPKCALTGKTEEFIHGCPRCGYAVNPGSSTNSNSNIQKSFSDSLIGRFFYNQNKENKQNYNDSRLPFWIYIVCILILIILVICLYSCI